MNIAFVAVGRRVELVKYFKAAQQSLGIQGKLIGIDIDPLAPALQVCDDVRLTPRFDDPGFIAALVDICLSDQVGVMFPLIDPVIEILAENRIELERTGAKVAVVSPESARIAADKLHVSAFFQKLGLSTPRIWDSDELDHREVPYPLFIKPRRGSASRDVFKVRNATELSFFREYVPDHIIQEFLPGPEITTDVVCDLNGAVLGIVSRRRIEVRAGEVSKGVTVYDKEIQDACVSIAEALPAVGPITVQCLVKDGRPLFTEINARLGGGIPLAIAAGLNAPALILAHLASIHMDVPELGSYQTGLHITRYDESFFVRDLDGVNSSRTGENEK